MSDTHYIAAARTRVASSVVTQVRSQAMDLHALPIIPLAAVQVGLFVAALLIASRWHDAILGRADRAELDAHPPLSPFELAAWRAGYDDRARSPWSAHSKFHASLAAADAVFVKL